jgi:hypothetical protein
MTRRGPRNPVDRGRTDGRGSLAGGAVDPAVRRHRGRRQAEAAAGDASEDLLGTTWDLYVAAEMEEPDLWATYDRHDMVIFHEHDFEVFLDPDGDGLHYFEFEINARNTGWDLHLNKPYKDKGKADNGWEIPGLRTAVALRGTLNDPRDRDGGWTVEMAFPWSAFNRGPRPAVAPRPGEAGG